MPLPEGFHLEYAGTRLEDGLTWSEDELRARFNDRTQVQCGYCKKSYRSRDVEALVVWFHSHECGTHDSMTCACVLEAAA